MSYSAFEVWFAIVMMTAILLLARSSFLLLPRGMSPRGLLARALDYAPLAALSGIVAPDVLAPLLEHATRPLALLLDARLPAALALLAVALTTRNAFYGLGTGLVVYLGLRALG